MTPLYTDDAPRVAAREYPGCFTVEQVRHHLGQPSSDATEQGNSPARQGNVVTPGNHFLPNCICATLHVGCDITSSQDSDAKRNTVEVTLNQLHASAEAGCWFCAVIYGGIKAAPPWDPDLEAETPILQSFSMSATDTMYDFCVSAFGDKDRVQEPELVFYVDENEATSSPCKLFRVRKEPPYTDVHEQLAFTTRLLQKCLENHSCTPTIPSSMPTRLLHVDIQDGKYVTRLVEGVSPQPYVALSHCWGKSFPSRTKTTLCNIDSRKSCVPWADLSQVFRDTVALTERLGFKYIWIDALCIIQDSTPDWELEASRMSEVYSSSALMLSADASPDTNMGLFRSARISSRPWRAALSTTSCWGNHSVKAHYLKIHCTFGKIAPMFRPSWKQFQVFPLSTRAWCYQEQRLARRVVHFAVDEVSWDCIGGVECQCGMFGPKWNTFSAHIWQKTLGERECTAKEKHTLWLNTVTSCSERELSFWTDRLPSIAGLAKQFMASGKTKQSDDTRVSTASDESPAETKQKFTDINLGTYLAGTWSAFLSIGLCWYTEYKPGRRLNTASDYVAPSWSWASVSGLVNFDLDDEFCAEIASARCYPTGSETGSISHGEVILKARMIPVKLFQGEVVLPQAGGKRYEYLHLEARDPATGEQASPGMYRPDSTEHKSNAEFFAGAHLIWGDPNTRGKDLTPVLGGEYFGIHIALSFIMVVRIVQNGSPNVFERMGSIHRGNNGRPYKLDGWFEGIEPEIVKLV